MKIDAKLTLKRGAGVAAILWSLVSVAPALAQAASESEPSSEEIIVTAERRQQSVLDVPVSIVAMSGSMLREKGIDDLSELQAAVPSLSFVDSGGIKFFNIRGVGVSEAAPQQTTGVAVHLDGAYVAREFVFGDPMFDLASVEVLRGPQGTFQGQNASGGALYLNTVKPKLGAFEGFANLEYGSYNHLTASAALNIPLSSTLAIRLGAHGEKRDSYNKNYDATGRLTDTQPGSMKRFLGRAQLLFAPSDDFQLRIIHQYSEQRGGSPAFKTFALAATEGPRETRWDTPTYLDTTYNRTTGILDWTPVDAFRVHATLAYQKTTQHILRDEDYTNPVLQPGFPQQTARVDIADDYWTGEINLISNTPGPFQWTVGATFLDYKNSSITHIVNYNDPLSLPPAPGLTPDWATGVYIPTYPYRRNQAAFAEISYQFTDQLELKLGGRYNHDENGFAAGSYFTPLGPSGPVVSDLTTPTYSFSAFTGRAVLNFKPNTDTLFYASISRGYKPGGVAAPLLGFGGPYKSEYVLNYELGAKGRIADGLLNYSVALFYMDYKGYQATAQIIPNLPPSRVTLNIDGTTIKGIEAQLDGRVGGFRWDVSASYMDSKFGSQDVLVPAGAAGGGLPAVASTINIKGQEISFAPKFTASAGIAYEASLGDLTLTPSVRLSHQDGQWVSYLHFPYSYIPKHTTVDARVELKSEHGWSLEVYGTNLGDSTYISNVSQTTNGVGAFVVGPPREVGVRGRFEF